MATASLNATLLLDKEETYALAAYLGVGSQEAAQFRLDNPSLYNIEDAIYKVIKNER